MRVGHQGDVADLDVFDLVGRQLVVQFAVGLVLHGVGVGCVKIDGVVYPGGVRLRIEAVRVEVPVAERCHQ